MSAVRVAPLRTLRDRRDFVGLPWRVYQGDPNWVPPLRLAVRRRMKPRTNPFLKHVTVEHFLARDSSGTAVGRVAATVHPSYVDKHGAKAFFGMFECMPDEAVAAALLERVEDWASERGFSHVIGPYAYTGNQDVGILVEGFDQPTRMMQSYNPPYYGELLDGLGYKQAWEAYTFSWTRARHGQLIDQLIAIGDRVAADEGFHVRPVRMHRFEEEAETLRRLYNASFAHHPESTALSSPVFQSMCNDMRPFVDPELIRIIERDGEAIAFALLMPDLNAALGRFDGRVSPQLVLRPEQVVKGVRDVVVVMIGALPEALGMGLGRCLRGELVRAATAGPYDGVHTTWIHEDNWPCRAIAERLGTPPSKRYVVLERQW